MKIHETKYFDKAKNEDFKTSYGMKPFFKLKKNIDDSTEIKMSFSGHFLKAMIIKQGDKLKQDIIEEFVNKPMTILDSEKIIGRRSAVLLSFKTERR